MKAEEFQAQHGAKKARSKSKNFDGQGAIRSRLTEMQVPFREEVRFSQKRRFRADFLVIGEERPVLIEYNGSTRTKGGHSTGDGLNRDATKLNLATQEGFGYLVFTKDLLKEAFYFESVIRGILGSNDTLP